MVKWFSCPFSFVFIPKKDPLISNSEVVHFIREKPILLPEQSTLSVSSLTKIVAQFNEQTIWVGPIYSWLILFFLFIHYKLSFKSKFYKVIKDKMFNARKSTTRLS